MSISKPLTSKQVKYLRGQAHSLKVVVTIGNNGLTDNVAMETDQALERHELLKVRVSASDREQRDAIIEALRERTNSALIQRVGHVATLYRRNIDNPRVDPGKP